MEQLGILLLGGLAVILTIGVWHQYHRNKNREAAWPYRQRIAEIAFEIETDSNAPEEVRKSVRYLANEAFNERLLQDFCVASRRAQRQLDATKAQAASHTFASDLEAKFGAYYGARLYGAVDAFAHIALYADIASGFRLRSQSAPQGTQQRPASMGDGIVNAITDLLGQQNKHGRDHHAHA